MVTETPERPAAPEVTEPKMADVRILLPAKLTVTTWPPLAITAACVVDGKATSARCPEMVTV